MPGYVFRAYLHYDVRPNDDWSVTIEHDLEDAVDGPIVTNCADDMANALSNASWNNVVIDRIVVGTWVKDSDPYDIDALRTIPYGLFGTREYTLTNVVADELALFIRKNVSKGRAGKMLMRGMLTVAQLTASSGSWTILATQVGAITTIVDNLWTALSGTANPVMIGAALLDITYPATAAGEKQVPVKVYSPQPSVRTVQGLTLVGPRSRQLTQ